jgi:hypothetical protein
MIIYIYSFFLKKIKDLIITNGRQVKQPSSPIHKVCYYQVRQLHINKR